MNPMQIPDDIIISMLDNIENRLSYIFGRDFIITRRVSDNKISKIKVNIYEYYDYRHETWIISCGNNKEIGDLLK